MPLRRSSQALLDATEETYVLSPPEMWHPSWIGRYHKPAVKLRRALYGHPLASAFWEKHLKRILVEVLGLVIVEGHPSAFYHPQWELLLVVYVDDMLMTYSLRDRPPAKISFGML